MLKRERREVWIDVEEEEEKYLLTCNSIRK